MGTESQSRPTPTFRSHFSHVDLNARSQMFADAFADVGSRRLRPLATSVELGLGADDDCRFFRSSDGGVEKVPCREVQTPAKVHVDQMVALAALVFVDGHGVGWSQDIKRSSPATVEGPVHTDRVPNSFVAESHNGVLSSSLDDPTDFPVPNGEIPWSSLFEDPKKVDSSPGSPRT